MKSDKKFLIVGSGSMGRRRVRCLLAFDIVTENILVFDVRQDRRLECERLHGVGTVPSFAEGMEWNPDVVVVSLPTKHHVEICLAAARAGKDIWCEIALSHQMEDVAELVQLVTQKELIFGIGLNNPFHYGLHQTKEWLREFGPVLTYNITIGNYLPNWHPWEDYRDFYDETQIMGVIAQELGTMYSLLDTRLTEVSGYLHSLSSLDIPGPDVVQLLARTTENTAFSLQIDLLQDQHPYKYRLVSERGVIEVSFMPDVYARRYLNETQAVTEVLPPAGYTFEQCYIDEFGSFLQALESRQPWYHSLADGAQIVECLVGLEESDRTGRKVQV